MPDWTKKFARSPAILLSATCVLALAIVLVMSACRTRGPAADSAPTSVEAPAPAEVTANLVVNSAPPIVPPPAVVPQRPRLDREPLLRVFLLRGHSLTFSLNASATCAGQTFAAGPVSATVSGGRLSLNGQPVAGKEAALVMAAAPAGRFTATPVPPFGAVKTMRFAGEPVLMIDRDEVLLLERVPLETYLAGVLPTEMNPSWPLAALQAQAIAARSYAASQYLTRWDRAWNIHWHYTVDMAYAGVPTRTSVTVAEAISSTRGQVLDVRGQPLLALFYACSGGRTEAAANVFPNLRLADGSNAAAAMPSVNDAAAQAGCNGLKFPTHWRWKCDLPLKDVSAGLQAWSHEQSGRPTFGTVTDVRAEGRFTDSGRVEQVAIRHRIDKKERTTRIPASEFRLAVGPGVVRSTWWDRCLTVSTKGGQVVISGRGFGHGVGLSQVSAWQMAHDGKGPGAILAVFYPGAPVVMRWP